MHNIIGHKFKSLSKNNEGFIFYKDGIARIIGPYEDIGKWNLDNDKVIVQWSKYSKDIIVFDEKKNVIRSEKHNWEAILTDEVVPDYYSLLISSGFDHFHRYENDMYDFLDTFLFILQFELGKSSKNYCIDGDKTEYAKKFTEANSKEKTSFLFNSPHHTGILNSILINNRKNRIIAPSKKDMNRYKDDFEHGLIHGIFSSFINFIIYRNNGLILDNIQQNEDYIHNLVSCMLHDFAKEYNEHDKYVHNFFPCLNEEVYSHSNPDKLTEKKNLIISDRCELMRYADYEKWVHHDKFLIDLPESLHDYIKFFYVNIRPKLLKILSIVQDPIISCSIETSKLPDTIPDFYPWDYEYIWSNTYCVYDTYFEDLPYGWGSSICGIKSIYDMNQETQNYPLIRDHTNIKDTPPAPLGSWVFLNKRKNKDRKMCLHEIYFANNNIYTINIEILLKLLMVQRQFYSRLLVNAMPLN